MLLALKLPNLIVAQNTLWHTGADTFITWNVTDKNLVTFGLHQQIPRPCFLLAMASGELLLEMKGQRRTVFESFILLLLLFGFSLD